jgi:hypothetical protein
VVPDRPTEEITRVVEKSLKIAMEKVPDRPSATASATAPLRA